MFHLLSLLLVAVICAGCKKAPQSAARAASSPVQQTAPPQTGPANPKVAACKLIATDEVGAIQNARITDTKSSAGWSGNLLMSQCYYAAIEPDKSVSVAVIEKNPQSAESDPRRFWAQTFSSLKEAARGEDEAGEKNENSSGEAREEQEKKLPRTKIDGVGEEAFWSGNRFGGALYVLQKDIVLRVSVGGPDNEETKIAKSKAIAQKALRNL
jgi:hypothetical protein